ncbi:hypothetical protein ACWEV3_33585 [Saccharopolyspora sp. NPDC003752]
MPQRVEPRDGFGVLPPLRAPPVVAQRSAVHRQEPVDDELLDVAEDRLRLLVVLSRDVDDVLFLFRENGIVGRAHVFGHLSLRGSANTGCSGGRIPWIAPTAHRNLPARAARRW